MASSSSLAPPSLTPVMKDGECRNWAELPSDLTSWILSKLSAVDILQNAQKVCTKWHRVCKDPAMWRKIDMRNSGDLRYNLVMIGYILMAEMRLLGKLSNIDEMKMVLDN
uniref:F-box domain-containing protein n=1 Tax=Brassica oleracea var. oleracea TaxID=109376 RepID=A0A0D3DG11_BRAOL